MFPKFSRVENEFRIPRRGKTNVLHHFHSPIKNWNSRHLNYPNILESAKVQDANE